MTRSARPSSSDAPTAASAPGFDPRDPRWKLCPVGCRPAAGVHRFDCPNAAVAQRVTKPKPDGGRTFS